MNDIWMLSAKRRQKNMWKTLVAILSCVVFFFTIYSLTAPATALNEEDTYTFYLKDSYDYSWKEGLETDYSLDLYFMDTNGNYIEGKDITLEIGPNDFKDDPYGFGFVPINGETTRGMDIIDALNLSEYSLPTGEKYVFDHAEVYVNDAWYNFSKDSTHWDIWCQNSSSSTEQTNYGWRGRYGDNISYTITSTTKYRFVYKLIREGQDNAVESLGADSGISFNVFNYSGDNSETGINANGIFEYFSFRGLISEVTGNLNVNTDADGFTENRAKVLPNLENGYPVFNCQGYCDNTNLGYLFGSDTNPNGVIPVGVTKYNSINTLLQKETIGGVEYYYYDSNRNAVDYDTENNQFMLRNYVERGHSMSKYPNEADRYEFLPFNYWTSNQNLNVIEDTNFSYNYEEEEVDHWFGMTMEFSFYMPKDGIINGTDMVFEFSGDDDVWVFVDDILVLDLGGTHGAVDGSINFKTGDVSAFINWNDNVGTPNETTIYDAFNLANAADTVSWNSDNTTFDDYTLHTVKFFYLERGAAISNCTIKFNIPVLPSGSLSVQKLFDGAYSYDDDYEFTLYDVTSGTSASNVKYIVGDVEHYTDNNGTFSLKKNEVAIFKLTNYHKYYVSETNTGPHSQHHSCTLDGVPCENINRTDKFVIEPDSAYQATFTNKVKTYNLKVTKVAYASEDNEEFNFMIMLKNKDGVPVQVPNDIISLNQYTIDNNNATITYALKNNESIIINNIPIDTIVNLEETDSDGYTTVIKTGDITLSNGNTYKFTMDSDKEITVYNTPGVVLPETGGSGILRYLITGFGLILISFIIFIGILLKRINSR